MSMVSFLSCGCSDQAGASEGMWVPGAPIVFRWLWSEVARNGHRSQMLIKVSSSAKADDPAFRGSRDGIARPRLTGYPAGACHRARQKARPDGGMRQPMPRLLSGPFG